MGSKILISKDPDYEQLPQTDDVKINKAVKKLSNLYPEKCFSDLLDQVRGIAIEHITENM